MTVNSIRNEVARLTSKLLLAGLAIESNESILDSGRGIVTATWAGCVPSFDNLFATIDEYRYYVRNKQYNLILFDGSLLQISYTFRRNELVKHRLCFYPCPFHLEREEWAFYQESGFGLLDILESFNFDEFQQHMRLQGPLRFDFDPENESMSHPASHLHILRSDCRIPVFAPLSIGHFIQFIFRNFFFEQWNENEFLRSWPCERFNSALKDIQRSQLHLSCLE